MILNLRTQLSPTRLNVFQWTNEETLPENRCFARGVIECPECHVVSLIVPYAGSCHPPGSDEPVCRILVVCSLWRFHSCPIRYQKVILLEENDSVCDLRGAAF